MIASSPDGQWAAARRGREVVLWAGGAGPATARIELPTADADLVMVGPPSVLAVVTRGAAGGEPCHRIVLYQPPNLEPVARHDLDTAMRIAGLTGSRLVLVSLDGKAVVIVRIAGRALATQVVEPASPVEFAVGLERNQVLFSLLRKLETWDAVSGRPLLRMQLPLPPPPRIVGPAHGFLWVTRPGGDDILVFRLSDGRPFRHALGVAIDDVIYHPASPLLVLVTARGLVRLHCYAHSLTVIDAPWQPGTELGQLVAGEDIRLLGIADPDPEPWSVPIGGAGAPVAAAEAPDAAGEPVVTAAERLRAMRERGLHEPVGRGERAEPADRPAPGPGLPGRGGLERVGGLRLSLADRSEPIRFGDRPDGNELFRRADAGDRPQGHPLFRRKGPPDPGEPIRREPVPPGGGDHRSDPGAPIVGGETSESSEPTRRSDGDRSEPTGRSDRSEPARRDDRAGGPPGLSPALSAMLARRAEPRSRAWRDPLATFGGDLARGADADLAAVAAGPELGELGELADRLTLPIAARGALVALYSLYLVGEPCISLARLAQVLGDWTEPLGQGELGALAMLRRRGGKVALRGSVTDLLDGVGPRAIRVIETAAAVPSPGAARLARDGRSDAAIEAELAGRLGRIAVIEGGAALALLEARLRGATAVALVPPLTRPLPWPRDAGLVVVAEPAAPAWVAALPALTAA
ncbi:MAG TPA: hypothetical protein VHW23_34565 [Kofleriaceae bacterium]|nr:hypothetical protein [Kofleriaceae bacterium]